MLYGLSGLWTGIIIAAAALVVIIFICIMIGIRNTLVRLMNACDEAFATIDVYLKKRYDLIPNLVETVKGYAKHEGQTLENVIKARNSAMTATNPNDKIASENILSGTLKSLFALSENYPNLKADSQFLDLQRQLQMIETDLAQARKFYNGNVKAFNTKIQIFPDNIIAGMMKLVKRNYFELDSEAERQNVKVSF